MAERLSRREVAARDVEPYQTAMKWEDKKIKRQKKKDTIKENRKIFADFVHATKETYCMTGMSGKVWLLNL
jgi:hypothetical protein